MKIIKNEKNTYQTCKKCNKDLPEKYLNQC